MRLQLDTILALFQIPTNALGTLLLRVITFAACCVLAQKSMWIHVAPVLVVGSYNLWLCLPDFYTCYHYSGEASCPLLCGAPGLCQGVIIHIEDASSTTACQDACTNFNGCNFYSFDPTTEECFMFDSCPALDDTLCPDCISGTPGCDTGDEGTPVDQVDQRLPGIS